MIAKCAQCGGPAEHGGGASRVWCSQECHTKWMEEHPEESARWIAVSDWTPEQRATVEAILGLGKKC